MSRGDDRRRDGARGVGDGVSVRSSDEIGGSDGCSRRHRRGRRTEDRVAGDVQGAGRGSLLYWINSVSWAGKPSGAVAQRVCSIHATTERVVMAQVTNKQFRCTRALSRSAKLFAEGARKNRQAPAGHRARRRCRYSAHHDFR